MEDEGSEKPVVVLVHGGASSSRMYKDLIPFLEREGFVCTTPDLPGHGAASNEGPFTFQTAVQMLIKVIQDSKHQQQRRKTLVVGISLGAQVVLSLLLDPIAVQLIDAAIVSGASIHPPDAKAQWELPRMPQDQAWLDLMMDDVQAAGWDNMPDLQAKSLNFTFEPPQSLQDHALAEKGVSSTYPPVLVLVGEHDTAMSRRDFDEVCEKVKRLNHKSQGSVVEGAAHNHSIDDPKMFARIIEEWATNVL